MDTIEAHGVRGQEQDGCRGGFADEDPRTVAPAFDEPYESGGDMQVMERDMGTARRQVMARCFGAEDCWVERRHRRTARGMASVWEVLVFFDTGIARGEGQWLSEAVEAAVADAGPHVAVAVKYATAGGEGAVA